MIDWTAKMKNGSPAIRVKMSGEKVSRFRRVPGGNNLPDVYSATIPEWWADGTYQDIPYDEDGRYFEFDFEELALENIPEDER